MNRKTIIEEAINNLVNHNQPNDQLQIFKNRELKSTYRELFGAEPSTRTRPQMEEEILRRANELANVGNQKNSLKLYDPKGVAFKQRYNSLTANKRLSYTDILQLEKERKRLNVRY